MMTQKIGLCTKILPASPDQPPESNGGLDLAVSRLLHSRSRRYINGPCFELLRKTAKHMILTNIRRYRAWVVIGECLNDECLTCYIVHVDVYERFANCQSTGVSQLSGKERGKKNLEIQNNYG